MASLPSTLGLLEQSLTRIHLLKFMRGSVMRDPRLRETAGEWWDRERKEGEWGRDNEDVQKMAGRLGFGYTEPTGTTNGEADSARQSKLRSSAQLAVAALQNGFKPSQDF